MIVYVLQHATGYYVGITHALEHRLRQHRKGRCITTRNLGELSLARAWTAPDYTAASKLERLLHREPSLIPEFLLQYPDESETVFDRAAHLPTTVYERNHPRSQQCPDSKHAT